ncbi:MAG: hypothetical protein ACJ76L_13600 [Conexibacter sp.]
MTLARDVAEECIADEQRPDGRCVARRPDLSVVATLARHGERELTPEDFTRHFGHLPADSGG